MFTVIFWTVVIDVLILAFVPMQKIANAQDRVKSWFKKVKDKLDN